MDSYAAAGAEEECAALTLIRLGQHIKRGNDQEEEEEEVEEELLGRRGPQCLSEQHGVCLGGWIFPVSNGTTAVQHRRAQVWRSGALLCVRSSTAVYAPLPSCIASPP